MLKFIKEVIQPQAVFWGGDSVPHNQDTVTPNYVVNSLRKVTEHVVKGLGGIKVYPTIGNHDIYPTNVSPHNNPIFK
jgi:hypothetical protein